MVNPILISLEWNIGAGKSTFIEHLENVLQKDSGWIFLKEPVHIWETIVDENGKTVLANFYEDPKKYAFAFQVMAFTTRYQELKRIVRENPHCKGILCERSLEADKHIFAKMLHRDGLMDKLMYTIYDKYFQEYEGNFRLDGIIHIDALPDTCFNRVKHRSRNGESTISLEYLQTCHDFHKEWLENTNTPVLKINVNEDVDVSNPQNQTSLEWLNNVVQFIQQFQKNKTPSEIETNIL